jgi:hypothetical protein
MLPTSSRVTWPSARVAFELLTSDIIPLHKRVVHAETICLQRRIGPIVWLHDLDGTLNRHGSKFALRHARVVQRDVVVTDWQAAAERWLIRDILKSDKREKISID